MLNQYGIEVEEVIRNASPAVLFEEALKWDKSAALADSGALIISSGKKNGAQSQRQAYCSTS